MTKPAIIGIVGGVGPYAGVDLTKKIFDNTIASGDQDHLPVLLASFPSRLAGRADFLLGHTKENPAYAAVDVIVTLAQAGATVVGIPCNIMHAPPIFEVIRQELAARDVPVTLVHMIKEVGRFLADAGIKTIGVLSTMSTWRAGVYPSVLDDFEVIVPDATLQAQVHDAIYHPDYGIQAQAQLVTERARGDLRCAMDSLKERGAEGILLSCTELPLAFTERAYRDLPLIDTRQILARALIRETYPEKLKK